METILLAATSTLFTVLLGLFLNWQRAKDKKDDVIIEKLSAQSEQITRLTTTLESIVTNDLVTIKADIKELQQWQRENILAQRLQ